MSSPPAIAYPTLLSYSALPTLRALCGSGSTAIEITDLPLPSLINLSDLYSETSHLSTLTKPELLSLENLTPTLASFTSAVYSLSTQLFKLLSHVLELPWERYLEELHELQAPSGDTLRIVKPDSESGKEGVWSTMTFTFSQERPSACLVSFGEALEVFSQGGIKAAKGEIEYPVGGVQMTKGYAEAHDKGSLLRYDLRPKKGAVYTRLAGAKMEPLSAREMENRPRVMDSAPWVESVAA